MEGEQVVPHVETGAALKTVEGEGHALFIKAQTDAAVGGVGRLARFALPLVAVGALAGIMTVAFRTMFKGGSRS